MPLAKYFPCHFFFPVASMEHLRSLVEFIESETLQCSSPGQGLPPLPHIISDPYLGVQIGKSSGVYHSILNILPQNFEGILICRIERDRELLFTGHSGLHGSSQSNADRPPFSVIMAGKNNMGHSINRIGVSDSVLSNFPLLEKSTDFFPTILRDAPLRPLLDLEFQKLKELLQLKGMRRTILCLSPLNLTPFVYLGDQSFVGRVVPITSSSRSESVPTALTKSFTMRRLYPIRPSIDLKGIDSVRTLIQFGIGAVLGNPLAVPIGRVTLTATYTLQELVECSPLLNLRFAPIAPMLRPEFRSALELSNRKNLLSSNLSVAAPVIKPPRISAGPSAMAIATIRWSLTGDCTVKGLIRGLHSDRSVEMLPTHQHTANCDGLEGLVLLQGPSTLSPLNSGLPSALHAPLERFFALSNILRSDSFGTFSSQTNGNTLSSKIVVSKEWNEHLFASTSNSEDEHLVNNIIDGKKLNLPDIPNSSDLMKQEEYAVECAHAFLRREAATSNTAAALDISNAEEDFTSRLWNDVLIKMPSLSMASRVLEIVIHHSAWSLTGGQESGTTAGDLVVPAAALRIARRQSRLHRNSSFSRDASKIARLMQNDSSNSSSAPSQLGYWGLQQANLPAVVPSTRNDSLLGGVLALGVRRVAAMRYSSRLNNSFGEDLGKNHGGDGVAASAKTPAEGTVFNLSEEQALRVFAEMCKICTTAQFSCMLLCDLAVNQCAKSLESLLLGRTKFSKQSLDAAAGDLSRSNLQPSVITQKLFNAVAELFFSEGIFPNASLNNVQTQNTNIINDGNKNGIFNVGNECRNSLLLEGKRIKQWARVAEIASYASALQAQSATQQQLCKQAFIHELSLNNQSNLHVKMENSSSFDGDSSSLASISSGEPIRALIPICGTAASQMALGLVQGRSLGEPVSIEVKGDFGTISLDQLRLSQSRLNVNNVLRGEGQKEDSTEESQWIMSVCTV